MYTLLTKAIFPCKCNPFPRGKGIFAAGAGEAFLVKSISKSRNNLTLHKFVAFGTSSAEVRLITLCAIVARVFCEESTYDAKHLIIIQLALS